MAWLWRSQGLSVAALCAVALAACTLSGDGITYNITAAQLQEKISPRFPLEDCRLVLACVNLSEPKVLLSEGSDRIALQSQLAIKFAGRVTPGQINASSKLRYDKTQQALFLDDVQLEQLQLEGVPTRVSDAVRTLAPSLIGGSLTSKPIYSFQADAKNDKWLNARIQNVRVVDGKLQVLIGWTGSP